MQPETKFHQLTRKGALITIVIGLLVLLGWLFDIVFLTSILPHLTSTNPVTAILFLLLGTWAYFRKKLPPALHLLTGLLILTTAAIRLAAYMGETQFYIDKQLFPKSVGNSRMAVTTCINFSLTGIAVILHTFQKASRHIHYLLLPVVFLSLLSLFGYIINDNTLYTTRPYVPMGLITTIVFLNLAVAFMAMHPENIFVQQFTSSYWGAKAARKQLIYILVIPFCISYLALKGRESGLFEVGFGTALQAVCSSFILLFVLWISARSLNFVDKQRKEAAEKLEHNSLTLEEMNKSLQRSNHELEQFAYVASHDLQEPLRKIQTFSSMLLRQDQELSKDHQRNLERINVAAERMSTLVKDLLDFSRLLNYEERFIMMDLTMVVHNIIHDFELLLQQQQGSATLAPLPQLEAIPVQINQLFFNLFSNAIKFSNPDEPLRISIQSRPVQDHELKRFPQLNPALSYTEIRFQDNGLGFPQEYADMIFEIFKRLHSKDKIPGSGIGLALCKRIVTNHQGDIFARSAPGSGTTFHIILPVAQGLPAQDLSKGTKAI
jgi:signal transduction histidine kinase